MKHTADIAQDLDLLVGANYLEIESQPGYQVADFYQVFQETSRHMRQRWFEISSFAIFCIGGLGTLEEVGMTLTDIKLGSPKRCRWCSLEKIPDKPCTGSHFSNN